jgi:phage protein U
MGSFAETVLGAVSVLAGDTATAATSPVPPDTTRPRPGMVKLAPDNGGSVLTLLLDGSPDRGGGVGGWNSTDRALRRPARWWGAQPEDTMSLPCILDLYVTGGPSIERRLEVLYAMGTAGTGDAPPTLLVVGDVPTSATVRWVMQNITLADRMYNADGTLRRQSLTVELEGYAPLPSIAPVSIKRTRTAGGKRKARVITTKKNDTLRLISVRQLGQSDAWKSIISWNPKFKGTDPDAQLRAGIKVTLR